MDIQPEGSDKILKEQLAETIRDYRSRTYRRVIASVVIVAILVFFQQLFFDRPTAREGFPKIVTIPAGHTLREASKLLASEGVISSPILFKDALIARAGESGLKAGDYYFEEPLSAFSAARRLATGDFDIAPVRVTVPEGLSNSELADLLSTKLFHFDKGEFLKMSASKEGYLFPDTYQFPPNASPETIVKTMGDNFTQKYESVREDVERSGKTMDEIVIMASILEGEARTFETRRKIAGILWKRIAIGMPLQVDAVFPYIYQRDISYTTLDHLQIDSPYNTYLHKGLPPGPISNPGIDALRAAATPIASPFLYYLTDKEGQMHYASTHNEHIENKQLFLR
jgi:UPF0755 protein